MRAGLAHVVQAVRRHHRTGHLVVDDGRPYISYVMEDWAWNRAKYRAEGRPLDELVDSFAKVGHSALASILSL